MIVKTKWIRTKEDWSPSYAPFRNENPFSELALKIVLYSIYDSNSPYLLVIRGADDLMMEVVDTKERLIYLYNRIQDYITKKELKELGLHYI